MAVKIAVIGGGGVRTPLLTYGLAGSGVPVAELALYDLDFGRARLMAMLGQQVAPFPVRAVPRLEDAVEGAAYVLSSIRVGGIAARARDERIAIGHGYPGQETTGPAGVAMALRTVPVVLDHARIIERLAPRAWYISFTNPAGLISQAVAAHTNLRAIGICDTPSELFHRIAEMAGGPVECGYAGLNHLGWIYSVRQAGREILPELLHDEARLRGLYSADLFDPALIRALRLIPTEYLFFYYGQRRALRNQQRAGSTRGAEVEKLTSALFDAIQAQAPPDALETYRRYLMRRNASYMKLEAEAGSAFAEFGDQPDPFAAATGYHRIAVETLRGLNSDAPRRVVVNVPNRGAIADLEPEDVVEVPCSVSRSGAVPGRIGRLPDAVRGLVLAAKAYERTLIRAATEKRASLARLAMLEYPAIAQWEPAVEVLDALIAGDPDLSYLDTSR
ncbi:MAG: 6-phospho-beta-glucosidase [Bryobacteraceae bacterium]|nr:6-phospho-beta-glucosidase [Bryobacteraceae bacterium]